MLFRREPLTTRGMGHFFAPKDVSSARIIIVPQEYVLQWAAFSPIDEGFLAPWEQLL